MAARWSVAAAAAAAVDDDDHLELLLLLGWVTSHSVGQYVRLVPSHVTKTRRLLLLLLQLDQLALQYPFAS